jgi:5-methylcytosine-specific restriction endonuclease McrA
MPMSRAVRYARALRGFIGDRDGWLCGYCGVGVRGDMTIDHMDPLGPDEVDNYLACCRACNSKKGRRTAAEYRRILRGHDD